MSKSKKPEPNPIEKAIGNRVKKDVQKAARDVIQENPLPLEQTPEKSSPQKMSEQGKQELRNLPIPEDLEEMNRQTEERLLYADVMCETLNLNPEPRTPYPTPASKPDLQPVTETSTPESRPPQKIEKRLPPDSFDAAPAENCQSSQATGSGETILDLHASELLERDGPPREYTQEEAEEAQQAIEDSSLRGKKYFDDKDLTALKAYILDNGFVVATVAMHIRMLCTSAMTTPSTTDWDFADRANIPDLVFALLHQPGYLEGIWPSLSIIMSDNKANPAWAAGISITIAFFDLIKTLPVLKELKNEEKS